MNMNNQKGNNLVQVTPELVKVWKPAIEQYIGADELSKMTSAKQKALIGIASAAYQNITGISALEADFSYMTGGNATMAANIANPVNGGHNQFVAQKGQSGSGDKQFLVGICIAIAGKTIGLELVQTVPATSQNVTIKYLDVKYNGGDVNNAANQKVNVVQLDFKDIPAADFLQIGTTYVVGHKTNEDGSTMDFQKITYVGPSRRGNKAYLFTLGDAFGAKVADKTTLSEITIYGNKPAIGAIVADGSFYKIDSNMTKISDETEVTSVDNANAIEDFVPYQTTKGLKRTLTRSEADAGTDRMLELDLKSEGYTIGNRVFTGHIARLHYKRLVEGGVNAIEYLTAALKNEIAQEVNWQIVSAARAYGVTNHLDMVRRGTNFNTFIGPRSVNDKAFSAIPGATELTDHEGNEVATKFPKVQNLTLTMQYETIESIGVYLAMLIKQACYQIGVDSRYGEGDAVVVSASLAGFLEASSTFTKLADKDTDMTQATGAKLSGYLNGIRVYTDVQIPANCPFVTVLRTNQDVKVDMPGIEGDNILIPGLAYLVKDLISTTELVPEATGGHKLILDSETDLIAVGDRPQAGYITFAFDVNLPGLSMTTVA